MTALKRIYQGLGAELGAMDLVGLVVWVVGHSPVVGFGARVGIVGPPELSHRLRGGWSPRRMQQLTHQVRVDGMV